MPDDASPILGTETPVTEGSPTLSVLPTSATLPKPPPAPAHHRLIYGLVIIIGLVLLVGGGAAGYKYGQRSHKQSAMVMDNDPMPDSMDLPQKATIIEACAAGKGTQYMLPQDMPSGPVYNVWKTKVIGLEFMLGNNELVQQNKSYTNLPLKGWQYDHFSLGLLAEAHQGFPDKHYDLDFFTVPVADTQEISCG